MSEAVRWELAYQHYGVPALLLVVGEGEESDDVAVFSETKLLGDEPQTVEWEGHEYGVHPIDGLDALLGEPPLDGARLARVNGITPSTSTRALDDWLASRGWWEVGPVGDGTVLWKLER